MKCVCWMVKSCKNIAQWHHRLPFSSHACLSMWMFQNLNQATKNNEVSMKDLYLKVAT